ncbi:putative integral membrane protein [Babesia bovis T2Bo]|uniref:Membrane protein, putative n=1 Tax=Babesia bovis TaxID=5865 RepID=A7ANY7_BABBO|nr:putative integral membrane protein [Babesia bovis T2Bo]EDO08271.1 putative integral membrane protein [Babesia bovis T2Bo]|eukprot:XP_001611839.1 membrane protein [Babesia bovis T2Bo]
MAAANFFLFLIINFIFFLTVHLWSRRANQLLVSQLLSEFDYDDQHTITFILGKPGDESRFLTPLLELLKESPIIAAEELTIRALILSTNRQHDGSTAGTKPGIINTNNNADMEPTNDDKVLKELDNNGMEEVCQRYNIMCTVVDAFQEKHPEKFIEHMQAVPLIESYLMRDKSDLIITFDYFGGDGSTTGVAAYVAVTALKKKIPDLKVWTLRSFTAWHRYLPIYSVLYHIASRPCCIRDALFKSIENVQRYPSQYWWYTPVVRIFDSYSYVNTFNVLS